MRLNRHPSPRFHFLPRVRAILLALIAPLIMVTSAAAQEPTPAFGSYAVAADHELASMAGAEMLARGGNAVDAAVAASFTLSVVRPFSCGIGGGGLMVISLPQGEEGERIERAICYRETAPSAAVPTVYEGISNPRASLDGGTACGVPGTVAGLLYALEHYGTLDRAVVMAPAIRAAREGFAVDRAYLSAVTSAGKRFGDNENWRTRFGFVWERFMGDGSLAEGSIIRNPEQADLLEAIARDGADAFYKGPRGAAIRAAVNRDAQLSGYEGDEWFSERDFESPVIEDGEPIAVELQGRRVLLMPPPSSGGIAIGQILSLGERRGFGAMCESGNLAQYSHELAEAFQFAFADRARYLADARYSDVPVDRLLQESRLDRIAERIDPEQTFDPGYYGKAGQIGDDDGTSHVSVIDRWGGAVACTETINTAFGSLLVVPGLGFCMNNEMDDFTTRPGVANVYGLRQSDENLPEPGKRPLSSMSPTIVLGEDGSLIVAGASGGPRIISATAQAILNVLHREMDASEAVGALRMHHQWQPAALELEIASDASERVAWLEISDRLGQIGHDIEVTKNHAVVQMVILRADGSIEAASDPRKGGKPAGE